MNRLKAWLRAFFGLSRRETRAFLILLPLMLISIYLIPVYRHYKAKQQQDFSRETKQLDSLLAYWKWEEKKDSAKQIVEHTLFTFNPNSATREELIQLGFPANLASRIDNYRSKNGRFTIKADLLRIYGMDSAVYNRLYSYIDLPTERVTKKTEVKALKEVATVKKVEPFDVNLADTTQLIRIYGIGSKLSQRIIKYRNQLGGFVSLDQLAEVYGLDTVVIKELKQNIFIDENFQPAKISINSATEKELAAHPYIKYPLAKAIATYRFQHGNFTSVEDLKKIASVDETFYNRIKPYLSLNP
jgi:competence protein ComEA